VEELADLLRRRCETAQVPNEFWPHHGNLSRELREDAEAAIRDRVRPATAVCTTTLELGIDVGAIESVAQVGCPPSVASLRQRLGRSGRSGGPAVLRIYIQEPQIDPRTPPHGTLRADLVETIAAVDLLLGGWCEPPDLRGLHLSTLVQQVLSLIAQHGAVKADQAWRALCSAGPFARVEPALFAGLLRSIGSAGLVQQDGSGEIVIAEKGERIVSHHSFYAAFSSPEEYRLTAGGRTLGSLPLTSSLFPGLHLIFGGRRWVVLSVDEPRKVIDLKPAAGGRPPPFSDRGGAPVHDRVRAEMLRIYQDTALPRYLDATARDLLGEGRESFYRLRLHEQAMVRHGDTTLLFPWRGDRVLDTLVVWLAARGVAGCREGVALSFTGCDPEEVTRELKTLAAAPLPDPVELASTVENLEREKFHGYLSLELLACDYAHQHLDLEGAAACVRSLLERSESGAEPTG
jgi:ATP-dependent Lhr-like helicase